MRTIKPSILIMFVLLIANICFGQSLLSKHTQISFQEESYFIEEGQKIMVCVDIKNPKPKNSKIKIKNTTSNTFLNFNPISVNTNLVIKSRINAFS